MKEINSSINDPLFKLAFFEPHLIDNRDNQVIDYLILDCISGYGSLLECTPQEVSKYIKSTFLMEFAEAEIIKGAERLKRKGHIRVIGEESTFEPLRYKFIKNGEDHSKNYKEIKELEELVISEWSDHLKEKYKNILNPDKINHIVESFKIFLTKICVRHGKESVSILYPESEKTQDWIKSIQSEIIKDLPRLTKELDIILQIEIPNFFGSDLKHRKKYLNNLFNASFIWHLIQIDESCTQLFKASTKKQILVLDANILFSLIGLHGRYVLTAMHNLLSYANQLEYKLLVTTKTLDEFYDSIHRSCEKAYDSPILTKNIANVAIETLDSSSFLVAYWKEFVEKGLSIEEFAIEKSHIESILTGLNISISNDFRDEIESSDDLLEEESILRSICGNTLGSNIIEHDAFHNIFIQKLRKTTKYKYSEAEAWFLTHDSKLPLYAQISLKGRKSLPFCLTANEWVQINRSFIKRTNDGEAFEQSFQVLVTQPYLRSILSNFKVDKIKEKILLRLNRYNNMNAELAFEMATDVHFISVLAMEPTEKEFDDKIDNAIVDINRNLQDEKKELYLMLDQNKEETNIKIDSLEDTIFEIKRELTEKSESYGSLIAAVKDLRKEVESSNNEAAVYKSESKNFEQKFLKSQRLIRWTFFFFLLIISLIFIWISTNNIQADWYVNLQNKTVIRIVLSIISGLILLNIPFSKHWKIWLPSTIAFIVLFFKIITK